MQLDKDHTFNISSWTDHSTDRIYVKLSVNGPDFEKRGIVIPLTLEQLLSLPIVEEAQSYPHHHTDLKT